MIDVNKEIASAMKARDMERLKVLKLIKTELVNAEKRGVVLDEDNVTDILLKMIDQRKDSIQKYMKGGREDLAEIENGEIGLIEEYVPEQPTEEDIAKYTNEIIDEVIAMNDADWKISMRDMKPILEKVKEKYPRANGGIVSKVLKKRMR